MDQKKKACSCLVWMIWPKVVIMQFYRKWIFLMAGWSFFQLQFYWCKYDAWDLWYPLLHCFSETGGDIFSKCLSLLPLSCILWMCTAPCIVMHQAGVCAILIKCHFHPWWHTCCATPGNNFHYRAPGGLHFRIHALLLSYTSVCDASVHHINYSSSQMHLYMYIQLSSAPLYFCQ